MLVCADVSLASALWGGAYVFRQAVRLPVELTGLALATLFSSIMVWVALRALLGLYPGYGMDAVEKLRRHAYSVSAALAMLALLALGFQIGSLVSRLVLGLSFLGLLFLAPVVREGVAAVLRHVGLWGKPVIVLSYKDTGVDFIELLRREWGLGYKPVALFDYNLVPAGESFEEVPYQRTLADAEEFASAAGVDTVIFAMPYTRRAQLAHMVGLASESFRYVLILPNLTGVTNSAVIARDLAGTFAVEIKHNLLDPWAQRLKRALDLVLVGIGGLLISPLLLVVAALIKLDSPGPVFFTQKRPGWRGGMFAILKFRTMYLDAEHRLAGLFAEDSLLREEFEVHGKLKDDPRVTRVGRFLRKLSLDELPQIWNVVKGEMSLVGPRPYLSSQRSQVDESEAIILRVPPGISGLWQVSGRSDTTFEQRVSLDVYYVRNWSVWLDIVILARTLKTVLRSRGAY